MFRPTLGGFILLLFATASAGETSTGERAYARGDYFSAAAAFRTAARKGDGRAQKRLGDMYADGIGVPQNYAEAFKWYCMAAEQGYEPSVVRLYALGFAGRPGVYGTNNLKAACEPLLHPPPEVEAAARRDKETQRKDEGVTINIYTTKDESSAGASRYYGPPRSWHWIKPHPPIHRPHDPRPPFALPRPGQR